MGIVHDEQNLMNSINYDHLLLVTNVFLDMILFQYFDHLPNYLVDRIGWNI